MGGSPLGNHSAAAAYAALMVAVGLPVWWKTTEVYRAALPYADIAALGELDTRQRVDVFLVCLEEEECHTRAPVLQHFVAKSTEFEISVNVRPVRPSEARVVEGAATLGEVDEVLGREVVASSVGSVGMVQVPPSLLPTAPHLLLGSHRLLYFSEYSATSELAAVVMDVVLGEPLLAATRRALPLSAAARRPPASHDAPKRTAGRLDLFLTLLVPQPELVTASWDIEGATATYLAPFLEAFPLDVAVKSQVLYLTPLDIPALAEGSGPAEVTAEMLGLAVNSVETALASQASARPALNLLVYLPPAERQPVAVQGSNTSTFLIPRWGGVMLYNYLGEERATFPVTLELDMARVAGVWLAQLRSLLGVEEVEEALPLPPLGLRRWEVDLQLRLRALQYSLETITTLTSLSTLLSQIPNIVISDEVGEEVALAVEGVVRGAGEVREGRLHPGFLHTQAALTLAESAFFDKSLLALLYFPDDQKYAIYIPFFLPVGIPVLLSLKATIKFFRGAPEAV